MANITEKLGGLHVGDADQRDQRKKEEDEWKKEVDERKKEEDEWKKKEYDRKKKEKKWKKEQDKWKKEQDKWKKEVDEWKKEEDEWKKKEYDRKKKENEWKIEEKKWKKEQDEWKKKENKRNRKVLNTLKREIEDDTQPSPIGYDDSLIEKITPDERKHFTEKINEIKQIIDSSVIGKKGSIDYGNVCMKNDHIRSWAYKYYIGINEETSYAIILRYILEPLFLLRESKIMKLLDNAQAEKTFSKQIFNLSIKKSSDRLNYVRGYWASRKERDFSDAQ